MTPLPTRPLHRFPPVHETCFPRGHQPLPDHCTGHRATSHSVIRSRPLLPRISPSHSVRPLPTALRWFSARDIFPLLFLQHKQRSVHQSVSRPTLPSTTTNTLPQHPAHQYTSTHPSTSTLQSNVSTHQHTNLGQYHESSSTQPSQSFYGLNLYG
jgi:hypothetical protein